jgi:hypothetical protein
MSNPFQPAIDELEKDLVDIERQRNALTSTINVLRAKAGLPPRPDGGGGGSGGESITSTPMSLRHDTFFGKRMGTAARQYLEMRHAADGGTSPATPREIFDALKTGGFVFETKDDAVAIISLRNMLRKNTIMFQKLPNGTYGLASWYPNAKKPKASMAATADEPEEEGDDETTAPEATNAGVLPQFQGGIRRRE